MRLGEGGGRLRGAGPPAHRAWRGAGGRGAGMRPRAARGPLRSPPRPDAAQSGRGMLPPLQPLPPVRNSVQFPARPGYLVVARIDPRRLVEGAPRILHPAEAD